MLGSVEVPAVESALRIHGGLSEQEALAIGVDPDRVIDFSVSANTYGPCESVIEAVRAARIDRYPDPRARRACSAIAGCFGQDADAVALGNGACELLWTLARSLTQDNTVVVIAGPTFSEFRAAVEHCGAVVHEWRAGPRNGFEVDLQALEREVFEHDASVVYLCSPNTPTGAALRAGDISRFAEAANDATIIVDQSFLSLSEHADDLFVRMPTNVVCVRSMTKEHAIPGVRLGYVVAAPRFIARLEAARPAWSTSAMAQAAALAACQALDFVAESRRKLLEDRAELEHMLRGHGLYAATSSAPFIVVNVGDAHGLRERLLRRHALLVRDCASFGLPEWIRLAARPKVDRERLETALKDELCRC